MDGERGLLLVPLGLLTANTPLNTGTNYAYTVTANDNASHTSGATNFNVAIERYDEVISATTGLVSYWRLNEGAGTNAADSAGREHRHVHEHADARGAGRAHRRHDHVRPVQRHERVRERARRGLARHRREHHDRGLDPLEHADQQLDHPVQGLDGRLPPHAERQHQPVAVRHERPDERKPERRHVDQRRRLAPHRRGLQRREQVHLHRRRPGRDGRRDRARSRRTPPPCGSPRTRRRRAATGPAGSTRSRSTTSL